MLNAFLDTALAKGKFLELVGRIPLEFLLSLDDNCYRKYTDVYSWLGRLFPHTRKDLHNGAR